MTRTRRALQLSADEKEALKMLYVAVGVTTDNLPRVPDILQALADDFNALTDRNDSKEDLLHYMITRRKKKDWPKIGRGKQPEDAGMVLDLDVEDWQHIDAIYEELQIPSDNFAFDEQLATKFAHEVAKRTTKVLPPMLLAAAIVTRRKRARLATLKPRPSDNDLAFRDIDEVA